MQKCPYCGEIMETGYIPTGDSPMQWIPEDKKQNPFRGAAHPDGIELAGSRKAFGNRLEACCCPGCKIVLVRAE